MKCNSLELMVGVEKCFHGQTVFKFGRSVFKFGLINLNADDWDLNTDVSKLSADDSGLNADDSGLNTDDSALSTGSSALNAKQPYSRVLKKNLSLIEEFSLSLSLSLYGNKGFGGSALYVLFKLLHIDSENLTAKLIIFNNCKKKNVFFIFLL